MNPSENPNSTPPSLPDASVESPIAAIPARRRFLGASAVATPAILTLVSQPALGVTCFTPSRSLSKNTSKSQVGKDGLCTSAGSPVNYQNGTITWPTAVKTKTKFHSNKGGVFSGSTYGNRSLLQVLNDDQSTVAAYLIAAYLNVLGGNGAVIAPNVMTAQGIKDIWTAWSVSGSYTVTAGTTWTGPQLIAYLISNGIVG